MTNFKFDNNPNNIMRSFDMMLKRIESSQKEVEARMQELRKNINESMKDLDTGVNNKSKVVTKINQKENTFQAYREVTTNGCTQYQKGIALPNGRVMWMQCPSEELQTAKDYLLTQYDEKQIEDDCAKCTDRVTFDDADFEDRINALLDGVHFLEDEEDPPTEEELNMLDIEKELEQDLDDDGDENEDKRETDEVVTMQSNQTQNRYAFVYDNNLKRFVYRKV